jgi:hypothetical protein
VGAGDVPSDGEPKTGTTVPVETCETLEGTSDLVIGDAGPVIEDGDKDVALVTGSGDVDALAGVSAGVVEEVRERFT